MVPSFRSLLLAVGALLAAFAAPALAGLPTAITDLLTCRRYDRVLRDGNFLAVTNLCQNETLAVVERCIGESAKLCVITQTQAEAVTVNLDSVCDLPPREFTYVPDLFRCGQYVQQLQSGNVPPALCEPDTLPTVRRCIDVGVRLGVISAAEAKALNATLTASCRLPRPG